MTSAHGLIVSAGSYHTCVLDAGAPHPVFCWGDNSLGCIGDGTQGGLRLTPTAVSGLGNAIAIEAGYVYTCVVLADHSTQCWGSNMYGQFGNGMMRSSATPIAGTSVGLSQLALGSYYACGLLLDGSVSCWGLNSVGDLGDGTRTDRAVPAAVHGPLDARQIAAKEGRSCALLKDGTVSCWGGGSPLGDVLTPMPIAGLSNVAQISVGVELDCALIQNGTVSCWKPFGTPTTISGVAGASVVVAGDSFGCAIAGDSRVSCWGGNSRGQLGDGTHADRTAAAPVPGLASVRQISAGDSHACAVTTTNTVWCWGDEFAYLRGSSCNTSTSSGGKSGSALSAGSGGNVGSDPGCPAYPDRSSGLPYQIALP